MPQRIAGRDRGLCSIVMSRPADNEVGETLRYEARCGWKPLRIASTGLFFLIFAIGTALTQLLVLPWAYALPKSSRDASWTSARIRRSRQLIHLLARGYVFTMRGMDLLDFRRVQGDRKDPAGVLVIANHPTLLDAVFMMTVLPQAAFVVKRSLARNPFTAFFIYSANYLVNHCEQELVEKGGAMLRGGDTLVLFPEGTRSTDPYQPQFKRGAAHVALVAKAPISLWCIGCYPATLQRGQAWYDVPDRRSLVVIESVERITYPQWLAALEPGGNGATLKSGVAARRLTQYLTQRQHNAITDQITKFSVGADTLYR